MKKFALWNFYYWFLLRIQSSLSNQFANSCCPEYTFFKFLNLDDFHCRKYIYITALMSLKCFVCTKVYCKSFSCILILVLFRIASPWWLWNKDEFQKIKIHLFNKFLKRLHSNEQMSVLQLLIGPNLVSWPWWCML